MSVFFVRMSGFCRNVRVFVGTSQNILNFVGTTRHLSECLVLCRNVRIIVGMSGYLSECQGICRNVIHFVGIPRSLSEDTDCRQNNIFLVRIHGSWFKEVGIVNAASEYGKSCQIYQNRQFRGGLKGCLSCSIEPSSYQIYQERNTIE